MEILNKIIDCSFSRNIIAVSLNGYQPEKSNCSKFCHASAAMLTSLVVAPIEAVIRFCLALITSFGLIGHFVKGEKVRNFVAVPIKLLASAELSITTMLAIFMIPYMIYKKEAFNILENATYAMNNTITMSTSLAKPYRLI